MNQKKSARKKQPNSIAIIGTGIGGLALAYFLLKGNKHLHIELFEKEDTLGGLAMATEIQGKKIEKFYHHIFTTDTDIISLIEELKLTKQLHWYKDNRATFYENKIYPFHGALDLLKFSPLPFMSRIRLGFVSLYLMKQKNWKKFEKFTAAAWLKQYAGAKAYAILWEPLLYGKFQKYFETITLSWVWSRITSRSAKLGYMSNSFTSIFESLGKTIKKRGGILTTGITLKQVKRIDNTFHLTYTQKDGTEITKTFDKVVATTAPQVFCKFMADLPSEYTKRITSVEHISAQTIILVLKHRLTRYYWVSIADVTQPALVVVEQSNLINQYNNKHIIYLGNYLPHDSEVLRMNEEQLKKRYYPFLKKMNKRFRSTWVEEFHIFRAPFAQPIVNTDYHTHIPDFITPIGGFYALTMSQVYPEDRGMNYAIKNAKILTDILLHKH